MIPPIERPDFYYFAECARPEYKVIFRKTMEDDPPREAKVAARLICFTECVVLEDCRDYFKDRESIGITAGMNELERRKERDELEVSLQRKYSVRGTK